MILRSLNSMRVELVADRYQEFIKAPLLIDVVVLSVGHAD